MQEMQAPSLGQEDPLGKEMTAQSSTLAWKIPWTEKPGGLQSMGSQNVRHDLATKQCRHTPPEQKNGIQGIWSLCLAHWVAFLCIFNSAICKIQLA